MDAFQILVMAPWLNVMDARFLCMSELIQVTGGLWVDDLLEFYGNFPACLRVCCHCARCGSNSHLSIGAANYPQAKYECKI